MRKIFILAAVWVLVCAAGLAWAQKGTTTKTTRAIATPSGRPMGPRMYRTISNTMVNPISVSFAATNPDTDSPVASSPAPGATVKWTINSTFEFAGNWTLTIAPGGSTFTGCPTVPTTAVSVACTSATGTAGSANCASTGTYVALPSSGSLQVASGTYPGSLFGTNTNYTVVLNYQFADSWKYVAGTCPLTVTYTVN